MNGNKPCVKKELLTAIALHTIETIETIETIACGMKMTAMHRIQAVVSVDMMSDEQIVCKTGTPTI